jgi:peptide-methionine (S)-S-oxide reductase
VRGVLGLLLLGGVFLAAALTNGTGGPPRLSKRGLFLVHSVKEAPPVTDLAAFSAGCFWGVEQAFRDEPGVVATAVGYSGGHTRNPTYEEVCTDTTGHAETVQVEYDPAQVTYGQLLDLFWSIHDPTTVNRQGPDVGEQYRSIIFYFTPEQREQAVASRDQLAASGELQAPIVTEIIPAAPFTKAEDYHQQYGEKGHAVHCHVRRHRGG